MSVIPKGCEMPSLTRGSGLEATLILGLMAGSDSGLPRQFCLLRRVFVRLVEKAVIEYDAAKGALQLQIAERRRPVDELKDGRVIYMFSFTDHMETCINAAHRACKVHKGLNLAGTGTVVERTARRLILKTAKDVASLRHTLEHIDGAVQKDEIAANEPIMLRVTEDGKGVQIGQHTLTFKTITALLERLCAVAENVVAVDGRNVK